MERKVKIGDRWVGEGEPVFIVAEAGANHDRKLEQATALIHVAADAGADAVKFQVFSADSLYSTRASQLPHLKGLGKSPHQMVKQVEIPREWLPELAEHARERGLVFLATPFDREAVDELYQVGMPACKWASGEITDLRLLSYAASKGWPMVISTGMCDLALVQEALSAVYGAGNHDVVLLHCTALYPAQPNQAHLRAMDTLREAFREPVGFSDHTTSLYVPVAAVARGACLIEKHYTLSRQLSGPDHAFALEPGELKEMVRAIREVEAALGSPTKAMLEEEKAVAAIARRSIIAARDIPAGTTLTEDMLAIKRPSGGLEPRFWGVVVGRRAARDIARDELITWDMV